ncbi:BppU family phage baseplate upper protein [Staphylococcus equorum]|uniref:BppU family phage baseplate upper protein n=1 Tax=Staphylococcus equorum TaxID=246432 RepID=UPI002DB55DE2|nr:BppU family phage baseplate upper protein [Staphylococcus equorum]MEB7795429.1 phage baseplate upper protein [Staphylococcus equorum]
MSDYNTVPNKKAKINLDTNAFLQSRSDLNVAFSTADRDTGIFEFTVTQNKAPLLLGDANIKSSIVFIHSKGLKVRVPLEITDGMNGKISVKVPDDILKLPGKVTSQVYVTRKTPDKTQSIVAERIFSFIIQESLAWEFDGETKLNYIIEFDELEEQLNQRVVAIEEAMANLEDYVSKVEEARDKGISDINIAKTNSLQELNDLAATKINEITTKGDAYQNIFEAIKSDVESDKQEVVENYNAFIQTHQDIVSDFQTIVSDYEGQVNTKLDGAVEQLNQNIIDGQLVNQTDIADMETLTNAETKRNEVLSSAQTYTDTKMNERFKTLWSGSVSATGVPITLNESYKNFRYVIVTYSFLGNTKHEIADTNLLKYVYIQTFNMSNTTAGSPYLYELELKAETETSFSIIQNHAYAIETSKPLPNSNYVKIEKIVGVR